MLSKSLYFNFSDQVYSKDELEKHFEKANHPLESCLAYFSRTYSHAILEKASRQIHDPDFESNQAAFVAAIWKAFQWRTTTHPRHETLALATLFDVRKDSFVKSTTGSEHDSSELERRMKNFLDLLSERSPCPVPSGMIFLPGPRLRIKGYGWAPRTWLSSYSVEPPDPLTVGIEGTTEARFNPPHGLEVAFPGFRLHKVQWHAELATHATSFYFSTDPSLSQCYRAIPADGIRYGRSRGDVREWDLAIITPQLLFNQEREIALLVAVRQIHSPTLFVEILHRIWISVESNPDTIQRRGLELLTPCAEVLPPTQR